MRTVITVFGLLAMLALTAGVASGDFGARPLAMGGAFIGLADDANATYYNPAGLAQLPAGTTLGTWTHTADDQSETSYKDYASLVTSFAASKWAKRIAVGASYVAGDRYLAVNNTLIRDEETHYWGSLAVDTGSLGMFGVNIRKVNDSIEGSSVDSDWAVDASYLYKVSPELTVGILAQDLNEPVTTVDDVAFSHFINWRAGLAYRPMTGTVVTVDAYDLADNGGQQSARFGVEKVLKNFTLRAGYYGLGSDLEKGATFGIGISKELYDIDAAVLTGDFDNTIIVSAGFRMF